MEPVWAGKSEVNDDGVPGALVSLFITGLGRGGAEAQLVKLAQGLSARGWSVHVMTLLPSSCAPDQLQISGIDTWSAALRRVWQVPFALYRIARELRRRKPRILINFMFHADIIGRLAAWCGGVPVVISSVRSLDMGGRHREWVLRLTRRLVCATTTNAHVTARYLEVRRIADARRLHVIPNGIEVDELYQPVESGLEVRAELHAKPETFVWLAIGRLEPPKDYFNLIKAFVHVHAVHPFAALWIAGEGPLRTELEAAVEKAGMSSVCKFLGLRDDIPRLLAGADALVQASAWEGLPNAVMEALAAARPVVATRVGGTEELVEEDVSGYLVPPQSPRILGEAMNTLMDLPTERRRSMGGAGREHIESNYALDLAVSAWETLFDKLGQRVSYAKQNQPA